MPTPDKDREVFRLAPPVVLWWVWVAFAVANLADFAVEGASARFAIVVSAILVTITGLAYALALRPRVTAGPSGLTIVNPFRDHHVPWAAIQAVDTGEWVRVHYAPARDYGQRSSADSKAIWCWALYVSSRAKRQAAQARSPAGFARPAPRLRTRRVTTFSGMLADARREAADMEGARMPQEARYLASLPAARAIAVRLDTRADRERARLAAHTAGQAPVTARWAWPPVVAVAVPLLALLIIVLA